MNKTHVRQLGLPFMAMTAVAVMLLAPSVRRALAQETVEQQHVVGIERIWDRPGHAAFTDIIALGDHLYCTFREGSGHIPGLNGQVRVIRSRDRMNWVSVALLEERHADLRDPKLAITPDERLMVNMGASFYHGTRRLGIESRVAFADSDGTTFGPPVKVVFPKGMIAGADWLWRITWHEGVAWGCVQQLPRHAEDEGERALRLVRSRDAVHFEEVARLHVDAPSETTLRFMPDATLVAMIRCEGNPKIGRIGTAPPPYKDWKIVDSNAPHWMNLRPEKFPLRGYKCGCDAAHEPPVIRRLAGAGIFPGTSRWPLAARASGLPGPCCIS